MTVALLVNGVPASGKSTLAARLVQHLSAQGIAVVPLTLDVVKEALYAELGAGSRDYNRLLGRASYRAMFDIVAGLPPGSLPVIDAWHGFQPPDFVRAQVARAEVTHVVEVWCDVAPDVAAARYRARSATRGPGHPPASYGDELVKLAQSARPLGDASDGPDIAASIRIDPVLAGADDLRRIGRTVVRLMQEE